jgi:hypothetical protein
VRDVAEIRANISLFFFFVFLNLLPALKKCPRTFGAPRSVLLVCGGGGGRGCKWRRYRGTAGVRVIIGDGFVAIWTGQLRRARRGATPGPEGQGMAGCRVVEGNGTPRLPLVVAGVAEFAGSTATICEGLPPVLGEVSPLAAESRLEVSISYAAVATAQPSETGALEKRR